MCLANQFFLLKEELNEFDRAVGDGDHGSALARGFQAAAEKLTELKPDELPKIILMTISSELMSAAGGASGVLFSVFFKELGRACGGGSHLQASEFSHGLAESVDRVAKLGKAEIGDKTMLDALQPASVAVSEGKYDSLIAAIEAAALASKKGAFGTIEMVAKRGRGRYVSNGGTGHIDPGARSVAYMFENLKNHVESKL